MTAKQLGDMTLREALSIVVDPPTAASPNAVLVSMDELARLYEIERKWHTGWGEQLDQAKAEGRAAARAELLSYLGKR